MAWAAVKRLGGFWVARLDGVGGYQAAKWVRGCAALTDGGGLSIG